MDKFSINSSTKQVLSLVIKNQPISRKEISDITGLSKPAVTYSINSLIEKGIVIERGDSPSSSNGGPRPKNLFLNNKYAYAISILLRPSTTILKICTLDGEMLKSFEFESTIYNTFEKMTKAVVKCTKEMIIELNKDKVIGVSVSIPANIKDNKIIFSPLYDVNTFCVEKEFEKEIDTDVFFERDVYNMAYGERWFGQAKKYTDYFCIWAGTGIGGVAVVNSKLVKGSENFAGEIGFLITDKNEITIENNSLNSFGSFEKQASISVVEQNFDMALEDLLLNSSHNEAIKEEIIKKCKNLALGIANIVLILNPQAIIINGRFRLLKKIIKPILEDTLKAVCPIDCKVEYSEMGSNAIILGGVYNVINKSLGVEF